MAGHRITQDPASPVVPGSQVKFTVVGASDGWTYQWKRNGMNLSDGNGVTDTTTNTLKIESVGKSNEGKYTCDVTNVAGVTTTSNTLQLTVRHRITQDPASPVVPGSQVKFTVVGASANAGARPTYQWQQNGEGLSDRNDTLTIVNVGKSNEGKYTCVVTNGAEVNISNTLQLTVLDTPDITLDPVSPVVPGSQVTFTVDGADANAGARPTYQWQQNGMDLRDGGGVSGTTTNTLTIASVENRNEGTYMCVVTYAAGDVDSNTVQLTVRHRITQDPASPVVPGSQVKFTVVGASANAGARPTYQWQQNGEGLSDRNDTLTIVNVGKSNEGKYTCVVTNGAEVNISNTLQLTVLDTPDITLDPVSPVVPGSQVTFTVDGADANAGARPTYQWQQNGMDLRDGGGVSGTTTNTLTIASVENRNEGTYMCVVTYAAGDVDSNTVQLTVRHRITQDPASPVVPGSQVKFTVVGASDGWTYQWKRNGMNLSDGNGVTDTTTNTLKIESVGKSNEGKYTCDVTNVAGVTTTSNTLQLTVRHRITQDPASPVVPGSQVKFTVVGASDGWTYQWKRNGMNLSDGNGVTDTTTNTLKIESVGKSNEGKYTCDVTNVAGVTTTSNTLQLTVRHRITQDPASPVVPGSQVKFTVVGASANAGARPTYQWQQNGEGLSDRNDTLTIVNVGKSNEGKYTCVVTNGAEVNISNTLQLTVLDTPDITLDPVSPVVPGSQVTFTVDGADANAGARPTYQWQQNGMDLRDGGGVSGTTTNTLTIASVENRNEGTYMCVVTYAAGDVDSNTVQLTVRHRITQDPASPVVPGSQVKFTVVGASDGWTYQWKRNGMNLSDGNGVTDTTTNTLKIESVGKSNEGKYTCDVTNVAGVTTTSNTLQLTVRHRITQDPASPVVPGSQVKFTVVGADAGWTYQWQRNGVGLSDRYGMTGTRIGTLTIPNVGKSNEGKYTCVVTNGAEVNISNTLQLTVFDTPDITQDPVSPVVPGSQVTFTVDGADANAGARPTYQWQRNGMDLRDGGGVSGTTTNTLTIASVENRNEGTYMCVVTYAAGDVDSNTVQLTVRKTAHQWIQEHPRKFFVIIAVIVILIVVVVLGYIIIPLAVAFRPSMQPDPGASGMAATG